MKRYAADDPSGAAEFENLAVVSGAAVPTPEPVHFDGGGSWFGTPTLVMSQLPGRPEFHPRDMQAWTRGAATALAALHDLDPRLARSV
jgi:aminoglycoside phosphotransferase (APT) family kinase protein